MGATLPVLSRYFVLSRQADRHIDRARLLELIDETQGDTGVAALSLERRIEYEKALEINPDDINVQAFLAQADASIASLEQLAAAQPRDPEVFYNLGRAQRGCRSYPAAIRSLSKAQSLDQASSRYMNALNKTIIEFNNAKAQNRTTD